MNALDEIFGTSPDAESGGGISLNYGPAGRFVIHRAGGSNRRYSKLMEAKLKPYTRQIQTNTMDEDVFREIQIEVFAKTIIIDWEGVPDDDGGAREYTTENVIDVLTRYPDLFADIRKAADDRSLFLANAQKVVEGNSQAASAGKSSGARKRPGSKA